jgi:hypothetical protein
MNDDDAIDLRGDNRLPELLAERERQATAIRRAKRIKDEIETRLFRFAERSFQQASEITLTKSCRRDNSLGDHFTRHFGLIGVAYLFARGI